MSYPQADTVNPEHQVQAWTSSLRVHAKLKAEVLVGIPCPECGTWLFVDPENSDTHYAVCVACVWEGMVHTTVPVHEVEVEE
jgi:hypothetical protein